MLLTIPPSLLTVVSSSQNPLPSSASLESLSPKWTANFGKLKNEIFRWQTGQRFSLTSTNTSLLIGMNGNLHSLNPYTGKEEWSFSSEGFWHLKPIFDNTTIYFITSNDCIYSINRTSGKINWQFKIPFPDISAGMLPSSIPLIQGDLLFCGYSKIGFFKSTPGKTYCLNKNTGEILWENDVAYGLRPFIHNGNLYTGAEKAYSAIDIQTGKSKWVTKIDNYAMGGSFHYNKTVILWGGGQSTGPTNGPIGIAPTNSWGTITSINIEVGKENWKFDTGSAVGISIFNNNLLTQKIGFFSDKDIILNAENGNLISEQKRQGVYSSDWSPEFSVVIDDSQLKLINILEKKVIQKFKINGSLCSKILCKNSNYYFLTKEEKIKNNVFVTTFKLNKYNNINKTLTSFMIQNSVGNLNWNFIVESEIGYLLNDSGRLLAIDLAP